MTRPILFLVVLVCLSAYPVFLQADALAYQSLWEIGNGQALDIEWADNSLGLLVHTTRGVDFLDQTLDTRTTLIDAAHVSQGMDLGEAGRSLTVSFEGDVWAWNADTDKLRIMGDIGWMLPLARRPQHNQFAISSRNPAPMEESVTLWDITTGQQIGSFPGITGRVYSMTWRPDGKQLAAAVSDHGIIIYDVTLEGIVINQEIPVDPVKSLAWRSDQRTLAISLYNDPFFMLWDTTMQQSIQLSMSLKLIGKLLWSEDGRYLAGRLEDGALGIWDHDNNRLVSLDYPMVSIADYSWNEAQLAVLAYDGTVDLWDVETQEHLALRDIYTGNIQDFSVAPHTDRIAVTFQESNTIHIFNAVDGQEQHTLTPVSRVAPSDFAEMAWNANGEKLAVAYHNSLEIWSFEGQAETPLVIEYAGYEPSLAWNPVEVDQLWMSWSEDRERILASINADTGEIEKPVLIDGLLQMSWSPDGEKFVVYRTIDPASPENLLSKVQILDAQTYNDVSPLTLIDMTPTYQFRWFSDHSGILGIECNRIAGKCGFWHWEEETEVIHRTVPKLPDDTMGLALFTLDPTESYIALGSAARPQIYILQRETLEVLFIIDGFTIAPRDVVWGNNVLYVSDIVLRAFLID